MIFLTSLESTITAGAAHVRLAGMASLFARIVGGLSGKPAGEAKPVKRSDPVTYQELIIQAAPERAGDQWRLAGVIIKREGERELERIFVRADTFGSREEAESYAIRKGKQIIDEQGKTLFADGEETGRA